jgi:hypothetical protein
MKRPKLKDMNDIELIRFRLIQHRRGCRRVLNEMSCLVSSDQATSLASEMKASCESVIVLTKRS